LILGRFHRRRQRRHHHLSFRHHHRSHLHFASVFLPLGFLSVILFECFVFTFGSSSFDSSNGNMFRGFVLLALNNW
jgi:hypothetical protein